MADDLTKKGPQDRSRVNLSENFEVRYWTEKFGVTEAALEHVVKVAGSNAECVEEYLKARRKPM